MSVLSFCKYASIGYIFTLKTVMAVMIVETLLENQWRPSKHCADTRFYMDK